MARKANDEQTQEPTIGANGHIGDNTKMQLRAIVDRIEKLDEDKKEIADNISEIYAEAKSTGFDVKAIRAAIKSRKQTKAERDEAQAILDVYLHALGDFVGTPLGRSAVERLRGQHADV